MHDSIASIARAVLYEGYILWPYHRSALKNQQRWTFGGVYPEAYSRAGHADDACVMRTECVIATTGRFDLTVTVRFLHVVDRRIAELADGEEHFVDATTVRGTRHVAWQEATEREIVVRATQVDPTRVTRADARLAIEPGKAREPLAEADGHVAAVIVRDWKDIEGSVIVTIVPVADGASRVGVTIRNTSRWDGGPRPDAQRRALIGTHIVLHASGAEFASEIDPPPALREPVGDCVNVGSWPVLVGKEPDRHTMLASPIILYDYPSVAPESSGDFFDAAEIDQLLVLSVLSMTDEEQARMRETDPRAREILDRCRSMSADEMLRLHGVTRELRVVEAP